MELTPYQWLGVAILGWFIVAAIIAIFAGFFLSDNPSERREDELKTLENVVAFKARRGEVWRRK